MFHHSRWGATIVGMLLAGTIAMVSIDEAQAAERHCVLHVTGQQASGRLLTAPIDCYATFAGAMAAIGVDTRGVRDPNPATLAAAGRFRRGPSWAIGIHYDGFNWTGSSITISGADCLGGWLNLSATWINRISSTYNGCPIIYHFDGYNLTGAMESSFGSGSNLSTLNNKANSIQYLS